MAEEATGIPAKDIITATVAVLGLVLGIINLWRGLEKEKLEIAIEEFEDDQHYPSLRVVVINQGNTSVTFKYIRIESELIQFRGLNTPDVSSLYNIFKQPEPMTLKPQEAKTFDGEDDRYPTTIKVIVETTRGEQYTRLLQRNFLPSLLGFQIASAINSLLRDEATQQERQLIATQIRTHFEDRVNGKQLHTEAARIGPFDEATTNVLINEAGANIEPYTIAGETFFKVVDTSIENTIGYIYECQTNNKTLRTTPKKPWQLIKPPKPKIKESKAVLEALAEERAARVLAAEEKHLALEAMAIHQERSVDDTEENTVIS
ncbi:MAG: hypothetical protein EOP06_00440 [Proteobacteria bacterium]|nr:MAG: hypothetical protein EOP06_00440 [Pseudomonadota bacterium]